MKGLVIQYVQKFIRPTRPFEPNCQAPRCMKAYTVCSQTHATRACADDMYFAYFRQMLWTAKTRQNLSAQTIPSIS
jgi:hypothetical protein